MATRASRARRALVFGVTHPGGDEEDRDLAEVECSRDTLPEEKVPQAPVSGFVQRRSDQKGFCQASEGVDPISMPEAVTSPD